MYSKLTDIAANDIEHIIENEESIDKAIEKMDKIEKKIRFKAFGKTKSKRIKKINTDKVIDDEELLKKQNDLIEKNIMEIINGNQNKVTNIFRMRKKIMGKNMIGASTIQDHVNNELMVTKEDIKTAILNYCKDNLKKNEYNDNSLDYFTDRNKKVVEILDNMNDDYDITFENFLNILKKFEKKDTKTYDFLIKAGSMYKFAFYKLCERIIKKEQIPTNFNLTMLHMIWKGKGQMNVLKNQRFLHMKNVLFRTVDALNIGIMKQKIVDGCSKFQIGSIPEHSSDEHLIVIKNILANLEIRDMGFIFLSADIISFFDKEEVEDCIISLNKLNVNRKAIRIWSKMSDNTLIKVRTSVGETGTCQIGKVVAQGTTSAAIISAANLDVSLNELFNNKFEVIKYGNKR